MSFSWKQMKKDAIEHKLKRAIIMAKSGSNPDFKIAHPDWVRDAQKNDFVNLKKVITEKVQKQQDYAIAKRDKRAGKN